MQNSLKVLIPVGIVLVILIRAYLWWQNDSGLLDEGELTGAACRELTPPQARALELPLANDSNLDRTSSSLPVRTWGLSSSCSTVLGHTTCRMWADTIPGDPAHASTTVNGEHRYFLFGSGQTAILNVQDGRVRCALLALDSLGSRGD